MRALGAVRAGGALLLTCLACGAEGERDMDRRFHFTEVSPVCGLDLVTTSGRSPPTAILEVKGGGLAIFDRDNDGDLDVFVPNGATLEQPERGPGGRLYDNLGVGDLRFRDATAEAGLAFDAWGMGVAAADVDGDGWQDLFVSCFGPDRLLRNDGGRFAAEPLPGPGEGGWSTGCAFGDVDGDGDLDLYVCGYLEIDVDALPPGDIMNGVPVFGGPVGLPPLGDVLYENLGDGTFRDVTIVSGCGDVEPAFGLGVLILDLDLDGRQEIVVGNDSAANFLFDDPEGESASGATSSWGRPLADRGLAAGLAYHGDGRAQATMGLAVADVDGNGLPDLFSTNFADDVNTLHLNLDGRFFEDRTSQFGLGGPSRPSLGWAALFSDLDLDGGEDLVVFNGHVYPPDTAAALGNSARQSPLLFARAGERFERFVDGGDSWLGETHVDRSAVGADLDADGDVDLAVTELNGPVRVLRNDGARGHWLTVALDDRRPGSLNRSGLGSMVTLRRGAITQRRWIHGGGSYLASGEPVAHFGLGAAQGAVGVVVHWPDGHVQELDGVGPDQRVVAVRR